MKVKQQIVILFIIFRKPRIEGGDDWKPFSAEKNNYMIIDEQPKSAENFHKCAMGMWTGDNGILGSSDCSALNEAAQVVTSTIGAAGSQLLSTADNLADTLGVKNLKDPVSSIKDLVGGGDGGNPLGGLLGNGGQVTTAKSRLGDSVTTTVRTAPRRTTTTRPSGGLLGLGGGGGLLG